MVSDLAAAIDEPDDLDEILGADEPEPVAQIPMDSIIIGEEYEGVVNNVVSYGAFVDIGTEASGPQEIEHESRDRISPLLPACVLGVNAVVVVVYCCSRDCASRGACLSHEEPNERIMCTHVFFRSTRVFVVVDGPCPVHPDHKLPIFVEEVCSKPSEKVLCWGGGRSCFASSRMQGSPDVPLLVNNPPCASSLSRSGADRGL